MKLVHSFSANRTFRFYDEYVWYVADTTLRIDGNALFFTLQALDSRSGHREIALLELDALLWIR